jgi:uncharacterized protein
MSAQSQKTYTQACRDPSFWRRLAESAVGAYLLNSIRGTSVKVFYWMEADKEVDFVLQHGNSLTAIEVKTGAESMYRSGMDAFANKFSSCRKILVGTHGVPIDIFLKTPIMDMV